MTVSRRHRDAMSVEAARLHERLIVFCEEWEGKVIEYADRYERQIKGLVLGHDGPSVSGEKITSALDTFGGWGCVVILKAPGVQHCVDPALVFDVKEIRRDAATHFSAYDYEAVDLFCPYGCDAQGLLDWNPDWSGPEYEVFCPVHNREARIRAEDLYHRPEGFDGSDPGAEHAYYELTRIAYQRPSAAVAA